MILSIYFGYHDSSVTVADELSIKLHLEAERYFKKKHIRFNSLAEVEELVQAALGYCGISIDDVDKLLVSKWHNLFDNEQEVTLLGKKFSPIMTSHHQNHVGCVLRDHLQDALIVCADGGSEDGFSKLFLRKGGKLKLLEDLDETILTGKFYGTLTQMVIEPKCSKAHNHDAGKLMGLASYGKFDQELYDLIAQYEQELNRLYFDGCDELREKFGISADYSEPWNDQRRKDLAYTGQKYWVDAFFKKIAEYADKAESVALAGGCALNVVLNAQLADSGLFKETYVSPVSSDSGQSIGAILFHFPTVKAAYPYLGRSYGDIDALPIGLVDDVADGKIVAWYQGPSEIGPRALGHRSFIGLANTIAIRDRLSTDIKKREPYRPVAPIIAYEKVGEYFEEDRKSPYMTFNFTAKPIARRLAPAIVHADNTSRVQTLTRQQNPVIYELLIELEKRGHAPIIMNSSFNIAGLPIVDTPDDAMHQFKLSGADVLYINGVRYIQDDIS